MRIILDSIIGIRSIEMNETINLKKCFCINCFEDENIKDFIKSDGTQVKDKTFKCEFCQVADWKHNEKYDIKEYDKKLFKEEDIYIIEQDIFNQKIIEVINENFEYINPFICNEKNDLLNLGDILSDKLFWDESTNIFMKLAKYTFIKYKEFPFTENYIRTYTDDSKKDYVSEEICWIKCWKQKENISWSEIQEHTKHKARYFEHEKDSFKLSQELKPFKEVYKSLKINSKNEKIYRARIINSEKDKEDIKKSPNTELGKTPVQFAKNNRFSPIGISYGYFSFDENTAIYEVRAESEQDVSIGTFKLKENLSLVDFRKLHCLSSELYKNNLNPFDKNNFNILLTDIYKFVTDISKPINEKDTLLEYVPTQIMSEYIWSLGYDGFIFDSSQIKGGENLVLFRENPKYVDYHFTKIK